MAKRKLSLQQQQRIATRHATIGEQGIEGQTLQTGIVLAQHGKQLQLACRNFPEQALLARTRASLPSLVTGDEILFWQDEEQVIVEHLQRRRSILTRPDHRGKLKPVAANIDLMVIVAALIPETPINLIDRYLVAAKISNIPAMLVLNKMDLNINNDLSAFFDFYERLGIPTLKCHQHDDTGIERLWQMLATKTAIFVGQSGAGKSSLIQALTLKDSIRIAEISEATGKGKHTTTTSQLYFHHDSMIIDSPGVRDFGLGHASLEQVNFAFSDISDLAQQCRFSNCSHTHEPDCAVKVATAEQLPEARWQSYRQIVTSIGQEGY